MTMNKISSEGIPCTYCDAQSVPGTDPPVCEKHRKEMLEKKASDTAQPETLKELDSAGQ